ncbi:DoxX family protein [Roseospirillum parvum]|uniref:Putative oxidoreductase n=1 Tax=Roseospirillum parvum TaxID=83401 RepID=A0A1G8DFT3_9PROT|nr:DoxX family protein [Roseospirillum parvum]SDH56568.1 putative oxidoreductase [Roseospirillum parvum]
MTPALSRLSDRTHALTARAGRLIPHDLLALLARLGLAGIFWRSGQTKVDGDFTITSTTYFLFADEYQVPLIPPESAAILATWAEHVLPILLVLGLASRLGALALLAMTATIQLFVYPANWPDHTLWATTLLYLIAHGPGRASADHLIAGAPRRTDGKGAPPP